MHRDNIRTVEMPRVHASHSNADQQKMMAISLPRAPWEPALVPSAAVLSRADMLRMLTDRAARRGGVYAYARQIGLRPSSVSEMLRGKMAPRGVVLQDIGLVAADANGLTYRRMT